MNLNNLRNPNAKSYGQIERETAYLHNEWDYLIRDKPKPGPLSPAAELLRQRNIRLGFWKDEARGENHD